MNIVTICLLGKRGGIAKKYCKNNIIIDSNSTARIQESHICIGHIICEIIEESL